MNSIIQRIPEKEIYHYKIVFDQNEFPLFVFINEFRKQEKRMGQEVEILPSVYCKRELRFHGILGKLENDILSGIEKVFHVKVGEYSIISKNIRNQFKIIDENERIESKYTSGESNYKNEYVSTKELPYPSMLGGGCVVWDVFRILGLYTSNERYNAK